MKVSDERLKELEVEDDLYNYPPTQQELNGMAKELLALRRVLPKDGEVLIALSRVEGYEDVSAELVAEDAMNNPEPWPEWRLVDIGA